MLLGRGCWGTWHLSTEDDDEDCCSAGRCLSLSCWWFGLPELTEETQLDGVKGSELLLPSASSLGGVGNVWNAFWLETEVEEDPLTDDMAAADLSAATSTFSVQSTFEDTGPDLLLTFLISILTGELEEYWEGCSSGFFPVAAVHELECKVKLLAPGKGAKTEDFEDDVPSQESPVEHPADGCECDWWWKWEFRTAHDLSASTLAAAAEEKKIR